jgi:hypothetical protein
MDGLEDLRQQISSSKNNDPTDRRTKALLMIAIALVVPLCLGEAYLYTQVKKIKELDSTLALGAASTQDVLNKEIEQHKANLNEAVVKARKSLRNDVEKAEGTFASAHAEATRTLAMTEKVRKDQMHSTADFSQNLAGKASQDEVSSLKKAVVSTRQDLDSTTKSVQDAIEKLGMTRTEYGTLIARNQSEVEELRKLGKREYYEFSLIRSVPPQRVGGVGLQLKSADPKKLNYSLTLYADDFRIEKKNRTINEPVFFFVDRYEQPVELVVNQVQNGKVTGYLSIPKESTVTGNRRPRPVRDGDWEPFKELKTKP